MLPQSDRSPFRNQRWVECEGSQLSFGDCVEVTGSTRPEQGSAWTPGGGRTVFQVVTPTKDSVKNTVIVGHMSGSKGYCTNDFPTYAKCDQNVSAGDEVGPIAGSRTLSPNAKGYLVMGDVQGGMARVRRLDFCTGTISFTMLTDRTRETDVNGLAIGYAQVTITAILGSVPDPVGATVTVVFVDKRWLEAVAGCQGRADFIDDAYVVTVDQGLVQGFWFITDEDRSPGAPNQDVKVIVPVIKNIGHANDDYSVNDWGGHIGQSQQRELKVRYLAGTYPRMLKGAIGYAQLDNDILNVTDNTTMRYYVVVSQEMVNAISGVLTTEVCKVDFTASGVQHDSDWPHDQPVPASMLPLTIKNTRHAGMVGESWAATWSKAEQAFVCIDMGKVLVSVPINLNFSSGQGCPSLTWDDQPAYIERCGLATPNAGIQFSQIDFVAESVLSQNGCNLLLTNTYGSACAIAGGTPAAPATDTIAFTKTKAVTSVTLDKGQTGSGSGAECTPVLNVNWAYVLQLAGCTEGTGTDTIALTSKNVVIGFATDAQGCLVPVYGEVIVMGQCGDDFNGDAILCTAEFVCPGSGSGSG